MQRLVAALLLFVSAGAAQTPYRRLAEAAKLWALVKYIHPYATSRDVNWDRAFADNASRILSASDDAAFAAAVDSMLAALHDPMTRLVPATRSAPTRFSVSTRDGVAIVRIELAGPRRVPARPLPDQLAGAGPVLFDLRNQPRAADLLPANLPLSKTSDAPAFQYRLHSGYQPPLTGGSGGYQSYWMTAPSLTVPAAANPIRPVFLVNSATTIPLVALAAQASGAGAIVSEDALSDAQLPAYESVPFSAARTARVRNRALQYADGTTGVAANLVLNATGDAALDRAIEIARYGNWPAPGARPRIDLPAPYVPEAIYDVPFPDTGIRLLAAARIWAVYHYFHPYLKLYDQDWDAVLVRYLERLEKAAGARDYHLAVAEMVALTSDSHCSASSGVLTSYFGTSIPFVEVRWIENRVVVTRVLAAALQSLIRPGDVVLGIDGLSVEQRLGELTPYLAASTPQSLMNKAMLYFLAGGFGSIAHIDLQGADGAVRAVSATRTNGIYDIRPYRTGAVYRLLDARTGYVDLERLTIADVNPMFEMFRNTDALVMDMRGYPQATAWSIAPRLTDADAPVAALFRRNMVTGIPLDGSFVWTYRFDQPLPVTPLWRYHGKTVMLTDARAISQSEHSGLFYRTANGTKFIGSGTTGANGDVTYFYAPGNIMIYFTGHDVRWPDGAQLQRVGLIPDIWVEPTIRGVAEGRDEVFDRALEYLRTGR